MAHVSPQEKELFDSVRAAKTRKTMLKYKDTFAQKGSSLYEALQIKDAKECKKACDKIYKQTTINAKKLFGEDYEWFMQHNKIT